MRSRISAASATAILAGIARARPRARGFTIVEAMVVVAIIAIITAIAVPSYSAYVVRGQRAAAKSVLLQTAQTMERSYTASGQYPATLTNVAGTTCAAIAPTDVSRATYCVTMSTAAPAPAGGFLLSATPCGDTGTGCPASGNLTFVDAQCDVLTLDNTGLKGALGQQNTAITTQCWER